MVHRHQIATHEAGQGRRVEVVHEQTEVALEAALAGEGAGEASDRHVRDREQPVELDAEALAQLAPVARLELRLGGRQRGPDRVVDEVEDERRARQAVAEAVQRAQGLEAPGEDALAALELDVLGAVAGEGGDDLGSLGREEGSGVLLARKEQHGQVAAVDDAAAEAPRAGHEAPEVGVQLRRAAGEIEEPGGGVRREELEHALCARLVQGLGPLRARLHVAMVAGEIAAPADVHLERRHGPAAQAEARLGEMGGEVRRRGHGCEGSSGGSDAPSPREDTASGGAVADHRLHLEELLEAEARPTRGRCPTACSRRRER